MTHFAQIDPVTKKVIRVIVAEQDFIDSGKIGDPKNWIQTSYNTSQGVHQEKGIPLRKNYAGIGYEYDENLDAFFTPKPYESWIKNNEKGIYDPPIPYPNDGKKYKWNEETISWIEISQI